MKKNQAEQSNIQLGQEVPDTEIKQVEEGTQALENQDPVEEENESVSEPTPMEKFRDTLIDIGNKHAERLREGGTMNEAQIENLKALRDLYSALLTTPFKKHLHY